MRGKTALITGGSRGIGRAIALELASRGINISFCYMGNTEKANETAELIKSYGVEVLAVKADVSKKEDVEALVKATKDKFSSIDILVNNAGLTRDNLMAMMDPDDFERVIATNLTGTFLCTKYVSRIMMRQKSGSIINISSVVGLHGNAGQVNYSASKAGVIGITKSVAKELSSRGIRVNAVAPGFIDTDMTECLTPEVKEKIYSQIPLGRFGKSEDVAKVVAFLSSDDASYITGQVISVDGGMNM